MTPITPLEPGMEMFQRAKTQSFFSSALTARSSLERPVSHVSVAYTDIEDDDSEFEEYSGSSVCSTITTFIASVLTSEQSDNRRSQTTISTFEEIQTPADEIRPQFAYWHGPKAVEGPRGTTPVSRIGIFQ
jgi:hypothetical protein